MRDLLPYSAPRRIAQSSPAPQASERCQRRDVSLTVCTGEHYTDRRLYETARQQRDGQLHRGRCAAPAICRRVPPAGGTWRGTEPAQAVLAAPSGAALVEPRALERLEAVLRRPKGPLHD